VSFFCLLFGIQICSGLVFYKKINGDDIDIPGCDKTEESDDEDIEAKLEKLLESLEDNE
jgi:hypothetical protein